MPCPYKHHPLPAQVSGQALLPGAALLELAAAAGLASLVPTSSSSATSAPQKSGGGGGGSGGGTAASGHHLALSRISLSAPLVVPAPGAAPGARHARVMVQPVGGLFEILSPPTTAGAAPVQHVHGGIAHLAAAPALPTLTPARSPDCHPTAEEGPYSHAKPTARQESATTTTTTTTTTTADAARARCQVPHDAAHLYASLSSIGLQYGPAFRLLDAVHASAADPASAAPAGTGAPAPEARAAGTRPAVVSGAAAASIAPRTTDGWGGCTFAVHPAALDCAFQLGAVVPQGGMGGHAPAGRQQQQVYVPACVELFALDCSRMGHMGHGQVSCRLRMCTNRISCVCVCLCVAVDACMHARGFVCMSE